MESSKVDEMYAYLNDWAISTGGKGREAKPLPESEPRVRTLRSLISG